ncbi:uncharacterized protein Z519_03562 [Cladophialophora bantiana CBS 173.52]|uniref:Bacteriophage T5 Orf172 DNA-binding domain-containing protein n=1 Tax=Cladophialophora bantiana (strain ATCC 10958 / CBS 173.52 / CDC B-1940 / NIH 8579) TaxID=1442370 RepID=A0A0D2HSQ5_CLAB1|nr:uncharacterized protein Z519_03562 [Cladophialophora bantiana CBS 173.52]KIW96493.1 hypothetical protein Z519_03562 [Cladophialophora bantiana CBS 173.52]
MVHQETASARKVRRQWQSQLKDAAQQFDVVKEEPETSSLMVSKGSAEYVDRPGPPPRYTLRSVPQNVSLSNPSSDATTSTAVSEFEPLIKSGRTLRDKLLKAPTGKEWSEIGDIHAFSRESGPGMIKPVFSKDVISRLGCWGRTCGYQPILKHHLQAIPYRKFVEALIHFELLSYWRRQFQCKHNMSCFRQHQEWFEVDDATASGFTTNLLEWITVANPYDEQCRLIQKWNLVIESMVKRQMAITSQGLLDTLDSSFEIVGTYHNKNVAHENVRIRTEMTERTSGQTKASTRAAERFTAPDASDGDIISTLADIIVSPTSAERCLHARSYLWSTDVLFLAGNKHIWWP